MTTHMTTPPLDVGSEHHDTTATATANGQPLGWYTALYEQHQQEAMTLPDYLERCREHPAMYASPHERLLHAIGEPVVLDTSADERLSRIFSNRRIRTYPSFDAFYGMEDVIDHIVAFLRHAAQGLEEAKQVLYLLGPVGGGKSSLAERLKELMEQEPFYALEGSPINESPLGLFADQYQRKALEDHYGMSPYQLDRRMKQVFGLTTGQWILQTRIGRARYLLLDSDRSIAHIALEVGYADQSAFTRRFRRATGLSPTEYRKMEKQ